MSFHLAMPMWLPMPVCDQYASLQLQLQALAFSADVLAAQMQVCASVSRATRAVASHQARLAQLQRRAAAAQRQQQREEEERRRQEEAARLRLASLPSHWDFTDWSQPLLVTLNWANPSHALELQQVKCAFREGAQGVFKVTRVERVQNVALYYAYESTKAKMRTLKQPHQTDLLVYHGTRWNSPCSVIQNGFNVAYGVRKIGHLWFASSSWYSSSSFAHTNLFGEMQIFCARICPFPHEQVYDEAGSRIYTVSDPSRMLPTYLITFRFR